MSDTPTFASGGVPIPAFAFTPDAQTLPRRAARLRALATGNLAPYLTFLADLTDAQAATLAELGPADRLAAKAPGMPPIDRRALRAEVPLAAFLDRAARVPMPAEAKLALDALAAATDDERDEVLANVLADVVPDDAVAAHLFAASAAQVAAIRRAQALDPGALSKVATGTCPACGGKPVSSTVTATAATLEGTRYATCATCATRWNEVRLTCLCCGDTAKISTRSVSDRPAETAPVRAELCGTCGGWTKLLYQQHDAGVEAVADDVGSLGLDALMREGGHTRGGFHPFLAGF